VANIGLDKNWCGHHFAQSNWYAFGRLAWNPLMKSEEIAKEWLQQTFSLTPAPIPADAPTRSLSEGGSKGGFADELAYNAWHLPSMGWETDAQSLALLQRIFQCALFEFVWNIV
jgi:hypothetical protein